MDGRIARFAQHRRCRDGHARHSEQRTPRSGFDVRGGLSVRGVPGLRGLQSVVGRDLEPTLVKQSRCEGQDRNS